MKAVIVALVAGTVWCAFDQPVSAADTVTFREKVLWSFGGGTDGADPYASLIEVNGTLYGTTKKGGANGGGAVFSLDPSTGVETVLYSFCSRKYCRDGTAPAASLINVRGILYGTTESGGMSTACGDTTGCGTVFEIDPGTGAEKVLYSFCAYPVCADGASPEAGLIALNRMLYGTASSGGSEYQTGTVFLLDPKSHGESVLHRFGGSGRDGNYPLAGLAIINSILYGTTAAGGSDGCRYIYSTCGTMFSLNPSTGAETLIHLFRSGTDGALPMAGLLAVNGTLYGTTHNGGGTGCYDQQGCGIVFSLHPNTGAAETVLHSFAGGTDGAYPEARLIDVKNMLYGTTTGGGGTGCGGYGCGTVFSMDPSTGAETVLYSFCGQQNCMDGAGPYASLIAVNGDLYGTTAGGGTYGYGTVFELKKKR